MIARILLVALSFAAGSSCAEPVIEAVGDPEAVSVQTMFQGLCDARAAAETGAVSVAEANFQGSVHAELHSFADRLAAADRDAAARVLEAKQRVEASFAAAEAPKSSRVADQLATLEGEVAGGAEALGLERPTCGGGV